MSCYIIGSNDTYTLARAIINNLCISRYGGPPNTEYKISTIKSDSLKKMLTSKRTIQNKVKILARVMYSINCYSFSKNYGGSYDDGTAHFRCDSRKGKNHINLYDFVCCLKSWLYQSGVFNLPDNHPKNVFYEDMSQLLKIVTIIMIEKTDEYEKAERY